MRKYYLSLLIGLLILISSCSKDGIQRPINSTLPFSACFDQENPRDISDIDCQSIFIPSIDTCGLFEYPDKVLLSDQHKLSFPLFCLNSSDSLYFENKDGDFTFFTVSGKDHRIEKTFLSSPTQCEAENTFEIVCYIQEFIQLGIENPIKGISMNFTLTPSLAYNAVEMVWIPSNPNLRVNLSSGGTSPITPLSLYNLNLSTSNVNNNYFQEFDLFGTIYEDVYVLNDLFSSNSNNVELYYNFEYGLVGYLDANQVQWKLIID